MGRTQQRAGGGLSAADRAKLVPENIRENVTLFEGTSKEMTGVCGEIIYASVLSVSVIHNTDWGTADYSYIGKHESGDASYVSATPNGGTHKLGRSTTLAFTMLKDFQGTAVVEYSGMLADSGQNTGLTFGGTSGLTRGVNKNVFLQAGKTITLYLYNSGWSATGALTLTLIR